MSTADSAVARPIVIIAELDDQGFPGAIPGHLAEGGGEIRIGAATRAIRAGITWSASKGISA